jgi:diaminohydroxyphosphoribosylaminopyrimidine deaminase/5-amino-6-(5-phosphoribosylamino)uracil reductase
LIGSMLDERMVDEVIIYIAPKILGGPYSSIKGMGVANIKNAVKLKDMVVEPSGEDIVIKGRL